jgi:hypothetical protein
MVRGMDYDRGRRVTTTYAAALGSGRGQENGPQAGNGGAERLVTYSGWVRRHSNSWRYSSSRWAKRYAALLRARWSPTRLPTLNNVTYPEITAVSTNNPDTVDDVLLSKTPTPKIAAATSSPQNAPTYVAMYLFCKSSIPFQRYMTSSYDCGSVTTDYSEFLVGASG